MFGFKDIPGFEGMYSISEQGRVYSYTDKDFVKPTLSDGGYFIRLRSKDIPHGRQANQLGIYRFRLAKLVYETFKGKTTGRSMVYHIDSDVLNSSLSNLEVRGRYIKGVMAALDKAPDEENLTIIDSIADSVCYVYGIDKEYLKHRTHKAVRIEAVKCLLWVWNRFISNNLDKYPHVGDLTSGPCAYFGYSRATVTSHLNSSASLYRTYKTHKFLYEMVARMFFEGYELTQEDIDLASEELDKRLTASKMGFELITGEIVKKRSAIKPKTPEELMLDSIYNSVDEAERKRIMKLFEDGYTISYIDSMMDLKLGTSRCVIDRDFVPEEKHTAEKVKSVKRKMLSKRDANMPSVRSQQPGVVVNRGKASSSQY